MNHPFWGYPTVYGNPIFSITSISLRYWGVWNSVDWSCQPLSSSRVRRWARQKKGGDFFATARREWVISNMSPTWVQSFSWSFCRENRSFSYGFMVIFCGEKTRWVPCSHRQRSRRRFWSEVSPCPLWRWSSGGQTWAHSWETWETLGPVGTWIYESMIVYENLKNRWV